MGDYPRDLVGYNGQPPHASWPDDARIAVQFVLNYEEGGENSILHGDPASEMFLSEIIGAEPFQNARHMSMESIYEYGSRAGVWRILDLFRAREIPITLFAVAMAMQRHPQVIEQALKDGHEIASHGYRWINYHGMSVDEERAHMEKAIAIHSDICGARPLGWYTGRTSAHTRDLVAAEGGFVYDADDYSDDLPFWSKQVASPHLVVPYTLDTNDMRFATAQGFHTGDQFASYLIDAFDTLYAEGATSPKMLSIGLHCRLIGRPARFAGLVKFIDHVQKHEKVWMARRLDIAKHWMKTHPYPGQ
ncbi:allantoinase PuuE [Candidatus Puniceispirillum marinum]|uniref:Chitooligosaccharide deacetylase n=1 Tax=Puniceispirillum marinum (strain IMCC1322) TaxID=488538 RepID=D5BTM2_PUNMI|nr:allantoinase PuuE [Candidatus Puniceispirillum marinum]ADE39619.1 polysaccharide deacetylase family protein [Candidatus Puniceispirillum marinum IMCC1322]